MAYVAAAFGVLPAIPRVPPIGRHPHPPWPAAEMDTVIMQRPFGHNLVPMTVGDLSFFPTSADAESRRAWLIDTVASLINANMVGLQPVMEDTPSGRRPRLGWRFVALVNVAYLHVAHLAVGHGELARCEECRAWFPRTDARQRYCPPGNRKALENRCSQRARARRLRATARQREVRG